MNILHLSSEFPPQAVYGLGRYVHEMAHAQAAARHQIDVITNSMPVQPFEIFRA